MSEISTRKPNKEINEMKFLSVQENKCITTWDIEKFSEITDTLESPHFYTNNKSQTWSLKVYPNGRSTKSVRYVSIFLKSHFNTSIFVDVNILILNSEEDEIIDKDFTHTFSGEDMYGYVKLIKRDVLLAKLNDDDILTLRCELLVENDIKCLDHSLGHDFGKVLGVFDYSDVTLSVDGKNFNLHKVILSARSPVFAAMFKHPMEESTTNAVKISGISAAVMDEVIRYIYTDQTPNLKEMVRDILSVADKYDLQGLKERCDAELNLQLAVNNAARALELADMYSLAQLKEKVIEFIARNVKQVIESPLWIELTSSNSSLTSSTLSEIIMDHLNIS